MGKTALATDDGEPERFTLTASSIAANTITTTAIQSSTLTLTSIREGVLTASEIVTNTLGK